MLSSALTIAQGDLNDAQAQLDFLSASLKINTILGPLWGAVKDRGDLAPVIDDYRRKRVTDLTPIYQGLYVEVFSIYELFVRSLIMEYVSEIEKRYPSYDKLKTRGVFIQKHIEQTGHALTHVFENRTSVALDYDLLAKNLASVAPHSTKVSLNAIAFVLQLATFSPDGLLRAFGKAGIQLSEKPWDELSSSEGLKGFFGVKGTRGPAKRTQEFLEEAVQRRNHLAHKGEMRRPVSESDVSELIRFLLVFHPRLAEVVSDKL